MLTRKDIILLFVITIFLSDSVLPQIVFKEPSNINTDAAKLDFIEKSSVRKNILLNGSWSVYSFDDSDKEKTRINIPSVFEGEGDLVFEKQFDIAESNFQKNNFELHFFGINHTADISINNKLIYKHSGGDYPFSLQLPKDLLRIDKKNLLSVRVISKLNPESTIPVKQRFLFPKSFGGIFRDVFIKVIPNVHLTSVQYNSDFSNGVSNPKLKVNLSIENNEFLQSRDSIFGTGTQFEVKISISSDTSNNPISSFSEVSEIKKGKEKKINAVLSVGNPKLWSPDRPASYKLKIQIFKGAGLIDEVTKIVSFYSLTSKSDGLMLNGNPFSLMGVTFIPSSSSFAGYMSYAQMEKEISLIKETGFNSIRFTRSNPHPYLLYLCERYGVLAFIELPLNSLPESLSEDILFVDRTKTYINRFMSAYNNFSVVASIGLGSGYCGTSESSAYFLNTLYKEIKEYSNRLVYASFINYEIKDITLDYFGLEILNNSIEETSPPINELIEKYGLGKIFISEAGYIANQGVSSGYTNPYTYEAQAKFFDDFLSYAESSQNLSFFLHTMFDYKTDYFSLVSGYYDDGLVKLGILDNEENTNKLSYKVVYSRLHNSEKVTIPLGIKKDNSPMVFVIFGLVLALFMGFLTNSARRFREDASRALIRPYNFFADIRDLRIISGIHTTLLGIIVSGTMGLITSTVLFALKESVFLEKLLVSAGNTGYLNIVSYLAWHPVESTLILTAASYIFILLISLLIKIGSFFVMNKVYLSNAYYTTVWSFLPIILSIPLAIVLYRLLDADILTIYLYIALFIFGFWVIYRLLKGVYVIYDVIPMQVYVSAILIVSLVIIIMVVVLQWNNLGMTYIIQTIKEFRTIEV